MCTNQQTMLGVAISLAAQGHEGQFDKSGKVYILHPIHVMNTVKSKDPEVLQIAVMHDVFEDTHIDASLLNSMGFSDRVIYGVEALTHIDNESYEDYIDRITTNRDAMLVKLADLRHNSDITRLKGVTDKDLQRAKKYHNSYIKIKSALKAWRD